ncbi:MAG: threonine--tRNA ligase [Bacillota bacterium]
MEIFLKDGSKLETCDGANVYDAAKQISEGLARNAYCGKVDGELVDTSYVLSEGQTLEIVTGNDAVGKEVFKHTACHILACAVKRLYPDCILGIGPAIDAGFYYDIEFTDAITMQDFPKIEAEMKAIVKENIKIERIELPKTEAIALMQEKGEKLKVELIEELPEGAVISFYKMGDFVDLCKGPHLPSTGKIKASKLLQLTGAYWKGDESNDMLTRIYGCAFEKASLLEAHLKALEEAKQNDHNKLGRELKLFMTEETIGQGLPLLMPKGAKIVQILQRFVEDEEERRGYLLTKTPSMAKSDLYKISGHWYHYQDKMFIMGDETKGEEALALRPMTCPFQYMIYKSELRSYRDLPLRYGETANLFRKENSGEMHGLIRVRQFTLSDGHIICRPDQLEQEFNATLDLVYFLLNTLGLENDVTFRFSKWDEKDTEKYIGTKEEWDNAQNLMRGILNHLGVDFYEADGEAAFYGPKLDVQIKNVYGKEDTIITLQVDFALAEKFGMTYVGEDGEKKTPYIIHRSSIGCYERTLALLIEKYKGAFPTWMAPEQVRVMNLSERTESNVKELVAKLKMMGIRAEEDLRGEKIGYKIREAQLEKVPYMVIIGDRDIENGTISVRSRQEGDLGAMKLEEFTAKILEEILNKVHF